MAVNRTKSEAFMLRLPDGMRDRLKDAAADSGRSMNGEIVHRLEESFTLWPRVFLPDGMYERAMAASPEQRAAFEVNLSGFAAEKLQSHFPPIDYYASLLEGAIDQLVDQSNRSDREEVRKEIKEIIRELLEKQRLKL